MSQNMDWLNRLRRDNKGIWGIEYQLGASLDVECLARSLSFNCEIKVVYVVKDAESIKFRDNSKSQLNTNFSEIVEIVSDEATENGYQSICVILADFHNANATEQCSLIKTARSIQESNTSLSCKFVFLGCWGFFSFRSAYREIHGLTSSPPVESKNILRVPSWCANDVLDLLNKEGLMSVTTPSEIDLVASDFLVEQTAGDELLICKAIEYMKEQEGKWPNDIEQTLEELASAPDVIERISARINSLALSPRSELIKLLRFHRLVRDYESIDCESLWLAGLVQCQKLEGGKQFIQIAGPLINKVVRNILVSEESGSLPPSNYLCFEREAISTAAWLRVAQIENMLRNLIVSEGFVEQGENWTEKLKAVKTPAWIREEQEELIKLVLYHVKLELSSLGLVSEKKETDSTSLTGTPCRTSQTTVLDSAKDWQKRQREHHGVELGRDNLMHFLTTESLGNILRSKKNGFHGEGKLFKNEFLVTALEEYTVIRSAIAHNQPIKLNTISRLDDLQRKFADWLTVFADQNGVN